jgi:hypothetical protein
MQWQRLPLCRVYGQSDYFITVSPYASQNLLESSAYISSFELYISLVGLPAQRCMHLHRGRAHRGLRIAAGYYKVHHRLGGFLRHPDIPEVPVDGAFSSAELPQNNTKRENVTGGGACITKELLRG